MGASGTISMLNLATYLVIFAILICVIIYILIANKKTKKKETNTGSDKVSDEENQNADASKNQNYGKFQGVLTRESIKDFMEFDEVVDNMIVRKNNSQYVMVLQCNGVNYDLMSEQE